MRSSAPVERRLFWKEFEKKLSELGNPFDICYEVSGDVKYYASVNKTSPLVNLGLTIDCLYRESKVKINIYIRDDVDLFEYIHSNKEKIEGELGFTPQWIYYGERIEKGLYCFRNCIICSNDNPCPANGILHKWCFRLLEWLLADDSNFYDREFI